MQRFFTIIYRTVKSIGIALLLGVVICGALAFWIGAPIALLHESFDLWRMNGRARGVVTNSERLPGRGSTSGVRITYEFTHNGMRHESDKLFPGYLANAGKWSGGSAVADRFPIGKQVDVYYDPAVPARCALEYGWSAWFVGFFAVVWGWIGGSSRRISLRIVSLACVLYGAGLIFFGPTVVRVSELHWHAMAVGGALTIVGLHCLYRRRTSQRSAAEPTSNVECLAGA